MGVVRVRENSVAALLIVLVGLAATGDVAAHVTDRDALVARHRSFEAGIRHGTGAIPFEVETTESGGTLSSTVRVVLRDVPFDDLRRALIDPSQWCEFVPIHPNVKGCTYHMADGRPWLRFFLGPKEYQHPARARKLDLTFRAIVDPGLVTVLLVADEGPLGSSDYRFHLHVLEVPEAAFVELDISSDLGAAAAIASLYLKTLGRRKVGFTVVDYDDDGPVYSSGRIAAAERNVVRYLLALEAYLATMSLTGPDVFERRIGLWFDATERYRRQLHELDRDEYIAAKMRERRDQMALQAAVGRPMPSTDITGDRR